jgi:hypothetical protein
MKKRIVAIIGKAGSGKDTLADMFVKDGFVKLSMADPLKRGCQMFFGFSEEALWGSSEHRTPMVREVLQKIGTDVVRKIDPDAWVKILSRRIVGLFNGEEDEFGRYVLMPDTRGVVIPDIRFPNEVSFVKSQGGAIIRIRRGEGSLVGTDYSKHESESALDKMDDSLIDIDVDNNGTLEDLRSIYKSMRCIYGSTC